MTVTVDTLKTGANGLFMQAGDGAVARTEQDKLREIVSIADFAGATDTAKIQAAIASGAKKIHFSGTYDLGTLSSSATLFDLASKTKVTLVADGAVTFSSTFADNGTTPLIFDFSSCDAVRFEGDFRFVDSFGYNATASTGVRAIRLMDTCTNFEFDNLEFEGLYMGLLLSGTANSRSIKGIKAKIKAKNCFYPFNAQKNGDDVEVYIHAINCRREYFVYGVRNHRVRLVIVDKNIGNAALIASYENSNVTEDIEVDLEAVWTAGEPTKWMLELHHQPDTAAGITAGIRNVKINYNVYATANSAANDLAVVNLRASVNGGAELTSGVNCKTDSVILQGRTNGHYVYDAICGYTLTSGLAKGEGFWPVHAKVNLNTLKTIHRGTTFAWTPEIGNGWTIGNGTAEGNYTIHGDGESITIFGKIVFGSTSTFGESQAINIILPTLPYRSAGETAFESGHPSTLTMVGQAQLLDASAATAYPCPVKISGATGTIYLTLHGLATGGGYVLHDNPFVWAASDEIHFVATVIHNNLSSKAP